MAFGRSYPHQWRVAFSHFHVVRRGVEAAHASRPCFDSRAPQVAATWSVARPLPQLPFLGRVRSHARRGIKFQREIACIRLYAVRRGVEAAQVPRPASTTRSRAYHAGHDLCTSFAFCQLRAP